MNRYEYMHIPVNGIPVDIMQQYNLSPLVVNGFVLVEIRKGMYDLPQAGIIVLVEIRKGMYGFSQAGIIRNK